MSGFGRVSTKLAAFLASTALAVTLAGMPDAAMAQNATWLLNPTTGDFNTAGNWNPATVPTGTAFFGTSNTTTLGFTSGTAIDGFTFNGGAPTYIFLLANSIGLTFNGAGIVNGGGATVSNADSGLASNNNAGLQVVFGGAITFNNSSTAGSATLNNIGVAASNNSGGTNEGFGGTITFNNSSTAGSATVNNTGGTANNNGGSGVSEGLGGTITFNNSSTAGSATVNNTGSSASNNSGGGVNVGLGGSITFNNSSSAGSAIIANTGGTASNNSSGNNSATGAIITFNNSSTAGNATITNTAATQSNNSGGNSSATGAVINFLGSSTAASAAINNGSIVTFADNSTAGNATVNNGASGSLRFTGTSTAGSSTINNNGNVTFAGGSSGGGARFINGTTGIFDISGLAAAGTSAGSIEGAGKIFLGSKNLAVGGNNLSTTFSGVIKDGGAGGSLTKTGTGTLLLSGVETYTGATVVDSGALVVNGSIATSSLTTINDSATLGGTGFVGRTLVASGGTFAPGAAGTPGSSTTVAGNLAFQSGALYLVQLNATTATFANVTGSAALAGNVLAAFAPGVGPVKQYTILKSAGLGGTTFASLGTTNLPSGFTASLSYTPSTVLLNMTAVLGAGGGLNGNQQSIASSINNFFNGGGTLVPNFFTIFGLTGGNLQAALTQLSGEVATASQQTTFNAMTQFIGVMTDPFSSGRVGAPASGGASGYADETMAYAARRNPNYALAAIYNKAPPIVVYEPRWNVWAAGYGGSQSTDGNVAQGTSNTTSRLYGTAVGADYFFSPATVAGFALGGGGTNFSAANALGGGRSDLFQAGAFVRHTVGPAYFTGALAYGWQDITTDRTVTVAGIDQLRAKFNANTWSGRVESGYRFATPWMGITPYAAGQFTTFELPAYAEQAVSGANTFALAYGAKSVTATRSEVGVRTDKSWNMADSVFTLRGRLAWAHDYNTDRSIGATFQTLPGASFVVNGAAQSADKALTTAGAEVKWRNGFSLAGTFEGEFSGNSTSYAGKGVARYSW